MDSFIRKCKSIQEAGQRKQIIFGQAIKGYWWMPRYQQAMKDAKPAKIFGELE
jgi:hypothetical protein